MKAEDWLLDLSEKKKVFIETVAYLSPIKLIVEEIKDKQIQSKLLKTIDEIRKELGEREV